MKRHVKRAIVILLACGVCAVAFIVGGTIWRFNVEDKIHAAFYPVIRAVDQYTDEHGNAPASLESLCPDYLDEIPSSVMVSEIDYQRDAGQTGWRLTLKSRATGSLRFYIAETGMPLSEDEIRDVVLRYHSRWVVREP